MLLAPYISCSYLFSQQASRVIDSCNTEIITFSSFRWVHAFEVEPWQKSHWYRMKQMGRIPFLMPFNGYYRVDRLNGMKIVVFYSLCSSSVSYRLQLDILLQSVIVMILQFIVEKVMQFTNRINCQLKRRYFSLWFIQSYLLNSFKSFPYLLSSPFLSSFSFCVCDSLSLFFSLSVHLDSCKRLLTS